MNDHQSQRQLLAYFDDELPEAEKQTVEHHLRSCDHCKAELDSLRRALPEILDALRESLLKENSPAPKQWKPLDELLREAGESSQNAQATRPLKPPGARPKGSPNGQ
jgi:anti-sigma factor RsiW